MKSLIETFRKVFKKRHVASVTDYVLVNEHGETVARYEQFLTAVASARALWAVYGTPIAVFAVDEPNGVYLAVEKCGEITI